MVAEDAPNVMIGLMPMTIVAKPVATHGMISKDKG
jgi:hypothetical protein